MVSCLLCNDLEKKDEDDVRLGFDFTPHELVRSAQSGRCASCNVILTGLLNAIGYQTSFERDVRRIYARCRGTQNHKPDTLTLDVYFEKELPKLELEFFSLQKEAWKAIMPRTCTSNYPMSPGALSWVKSLLSTCSKQHMMCRNPIEPRLPKRILAIKTSTWRGIKVKLIEHSNTFARYATLSHCWGGHRTLTTTRNSLKKHKKGIDWYQIPKTFQEAIEFLLELDIRYVWIDSLCIIQDDEKDWQIESSKMSDIYQHSYLTLAATASGGDNQGCYSSTSNNAQYNATRLPLEYTNHCPVAIRAPLSHWDTSTPTQVVRDYPLLTRAWVFQERILSPRVVHFCGSELVWECRETCTCECGNLGEIRSPGGVFRQVLERSNRELDNSEFGAGSNFADRMPSAIRLSQNNLGIHSYPDPEFKWGMLIGRNFVTALRKEKEPSEISRQWRKLVEQYSALRITRPTDRLPALAGLCHRTKDLRGVYMAGLWSDSIGLDLLWRVDMLQPGQHRTQRSEYERPTWSWISVDGPVSYWDNMKCLADGPYSYYQERDGNDREPVGPGIDRLPFHFDFDIRLAGENLFGEVRSAALMIQSYACTAKVVPRANQPGADANIPVNYEVRIGTTSIPIFIDHAIDIPRSADLGETVTLLLIHRQIALVLRPKIWDPRDFESLSESFKERLYTNVGFEASKSGFWERIGILRVSDTFCQKVAWLMGAKVSEFCIL